MQTRRSGAPRVTWEGPDRARLHWADFDVRFDSRSRRADGTCNANIYSLDTVVRVLMTALLPRENALLVHGAGIQIDRWGVLCPGKSGAGKSTLSKCAGAAKVLSDELSVARLGKVGALVQGTPFQGEFQTGGRNVSLPLRGLFFLHRGRRPECVRVTPALACARLLGCCLFFDTQFENRVALLRVASELCARVPAFRFGFSLDESWKSISARMRTAVGAPITSTGATRRPAAGRRSGSV